jgi:hypothetical protein
MLDAVLFTTDAARDPETAADDFTASLPSLSGPGGGVLETGEIDLRVVRVWTRRNSLLNAGKVQGLMPEMLLRAVGAHTNFAISPATYYGVADTDPTSAASCLRITVLPDPPPAQARFDSASNRLYGLEYRDDPQNGTWHPANGLSHVPGTVGSVSGRERVCRPAGRSGVRPRSAG